MSLALKDAEAVARALVENLAPPCWRIEVAGSIRRQRPLVNDIDLVAIPRFTSKWSMFAPRLVEDTDFASALHDLLDVEASGEKIIRGKIRMDFGAVLIPAVAGLLAVSLDVYIATLETWALLLLIRTGSAEHNIWLAQRAKACGGRLHADGSGLDMPGQYDAVAQRTVNCVRIRAISEDEVFKALGVPTPAPEKRECMDGRPIWLPGEAA
ncbi:MAG: hypothetical protein ACREUQ_12960 [Burkholderiales bacterium]